MMAVVVGGFTLCWLPFAVMFVLLPTSEEAAKFFLEEHPDWIDWITWVGE